MPDSLASSSTCSECGARLAPGQSQCELCGHPAGAPATDATQAPQATASGAFCNDCGWRNPPGARFCSQCGSALQDGARSASLPPETPALGDAAGRVPSNAPLGRTLGLVLGAAVLLVVALFVITAMSKKASPATGAGAAQVVTELPDDQLFTPLTAEQEDSIVALERDIEAAEGAERLTRQHEMVNLLIGFGRPDLAAQAQEDLARLEASPEAWTKAGDLYFQWMMMLEGGAGNPQPVALRALAAYDASVALRPEDLDVRARLAWAAQYDAEHPMRAIEETKAVLDADSTHVGALQNYAIFLARIGRTDQAVAQMERVRRLAGSDSLLARSANAFIDALRDQAGSAE